MLADLGVGEGVEAQQHQVVCNRVLVLQLYAPDVGIWNGSRIFSKRRLIELPRLIATAQYLNCVKMHRVVVHHETAKSHLQSAVEVITFYPRFVVDQC